LIPKFSILKQLTEAKVVAVIRGENAQEAAEISMAAIEGGVKAIELTYTTPQIEDVFRELQNTSALIGAGSVLDPETARHAILAGAKFIVSPHFNKEIAPICNRYGLPYLPGCMTLRDMVEALEAGCDVLKLFPANHFKPSFIKSVNGPLPNVRIMPTGGISLENINEWLNTSAVAVGIGSDLTKAFQSGGYQSVVALSQEYMRKINQ
jgi:2-dehydro-3-deoxyphosphogluconate aldolase/(4S)-4-hydroxy-2-oxoglutarate aldolase